MSGSAAASHGRRKVGATRNKQANFSAYEDNVLCKSWLEISCEPVINTGQRRESFWVRVRNRYNSKRGSYPERSQKSIMGRWDHIKADVSKFSGYLADMIHSNPSGMSDADKSVAAIANFAAKEKHNFTLMHCWHILKDEPKWMELKRKMDNPRNNASKENVLTSEQHNILDLDPIDSSPTSSTGKRPMVRDAAKAANKKAASASSEYVSNMHQLPAQEIELFKETKETEVQRKARLDEIVTLEKVKVEEAHEHRRMMLELERERLAMDKQRLQMEAEKKEKEEDERILAINLDQCQPMQRIYYQALQEEIIQKLQSRRRGPSQ
jgi:hypothetical protein